MADRLRNAEPLPSRQLLPPVPQDHVIASEALKQFERLATVKGLSWLTYAVQSFVIRRRATRIAVDFHSFWDDCSTSIGRNATTLLAGNAGFRRPRAHSSSTSPSLAMRTPEARASSTFASIDGSIWVIMIFRALRSPSRSLSLVQLMCPVTARLCS